MVIFHSCQLASLGATQTTSAICTIYNILVCTFFSYLFLQVFVDNLVHGDLHPGNMLVQNNSVGQEGADTRTGDVVRIIMVDVGCDTFVMDVQPDPNPLRICILDCGVVSKLSEKNLANIRAVFKQVVLGDVRKLLLSFAF